MIENKKIIKEIKSWTFSIIGSFFILAVLNSKVYANVKVQQSSMENTLYNNQQLIVDKLSYNFAEPKRGDIIIFFESKQKGTIIEDTLEIVNSIKSTSKNTNKDIRLVKRIIGIPGDEVNIKDGYVYINDKKSIEPYVKGQTFSETLELPIIIPKNQLFVLGDNRAVSKDSRYFGLINYNQLEGKVIFRVFPFNKIGVIK